MPEIREQVPLAPHTTLGIGGPAEHFAVAKSEAEMSALASEARKRAWPLTILGGGSNALVADEGVKGLVIKNEIGGLGELMDGDDALLLAGAGVEFDRAVAYAAARGWWGLENLSAIPGSAGATPIQNVGAYGVEVAELIERVRILDSESGQARELSAAECRFGYRDSIFKSEEGKNWIVTQVAYRLSARPRPRLEYRDLRERFADSQTPALSDIRAAVIAIRAGKFPDWRELGTAGSFFKNPVIAAKKSEALLCRYPGLPLFPQADGRVKVSLGWILDKACDLRGYRRGWVGLYEKQALVLVQYGGATAAEVLDFAREVAVIVHEATGIAIEMEPARL